MDIFIPGNPKQDQTIGKLFVTTNEYRRPEFGEVYFGEADKVACVSEDFGPDFSLDTRRWILQEFSLESGFTLVELLISIVFVIVLVCVIFFMTLGGMALWKYVTA
jgi:hypothetical protein